MSTTGTVTYRPTIGTVINTALRKVGALDPENTVGPTTTQSTDAITTANMILQSWKTFGLQLWERKYGVVFPQLNQGLYVLGSPGPAGDHACVSTPLNSGFIYTNLSTTAGSGAGTIAVNTITGQLNTAGNPAVSMTSGYNIGVQLDDGTVQWTTINGAPLGTTVTLTASLTGSASSGNYVYCYQTKMVRPLRIAAAMIRELPGLVRDIPLRLISKDEFNRFGSKDSLGTPVNLYYDIQESAGHINLIPKFSSTSKLLIIEFQKPIEDLAATTDDFDLPQEWVEPLMWNIAWRLAPEYEVPMAKYNEIKEFALFTLEQLKGWDQETESMFITPNDNMGGG